MERARAAAPGLGRQATLFVLVLGVAATVLDLAVVRMFAASRYTNDVEVVIVADLLALGALVVARRDVLLGAVTACAGSTALSAVIVVMREASDTTRVPLARIAGTVAPVAALPGTAEFGVIAILLVLSVRARDTWQGAAAAAATTIAMAATVRWRLERATTLTQLVTLVLVVALAAALATGAFLRLLEAKRTRDAARARATERVALSRELHDVVGHYMTGIVLQAQAARMVLDRRPDLVAGALTEIEHAGAAALRSMRFIVRELRSDGGAPTFDPVGGVDAFTRLATASTAGSAPVRLDLHPAVGSLPPPLVASLHRVALEAVTNARRYGVGATAIDVSLSVGPSSVALRVDNDGAPSEPGRPGRGFGLLGLAERVHALGGTFTAGPRPTGGWTVRADVPMIDPTGSAP